jgi:hypothetical protein
MLHTNDMVFRPNDEEDEREERRQPISLKKLLKGDACWATRKILLGWLIDTLKGTIELPQHRKERLLEIVRSALASSTLSVTQCHKLLGELRSMVLGIPGGRGLFSQLQLALCSNDGKSVRIHKEARHQLQDMWELAKDLASRPTRLAEILPMPPSFVGACDAAKVGMGCVWLPPNMPSPRMPDHAPIVWRAPFPQKIQNLVVSEKNPTGTITNSDLELAGAIAHNDVLVHEVDARERTVATLCDNTPATAWQRKGSVTTTGAASYLLRESAFHQRAYRYVNQTSHIPGVENVMADDASRRFDLSDSQLLLYFNHHYPQARSWQLRHLQLPMNGRLTSALLRERPEKHFPSPEPVPWMRFGRKHGFHTPNPSTSTHSWKGLTTKSPFSQSSLPVSETAAQAGARSRSELERWLTMCWPSRRRSPHWGPLTPG